jgi:hypothetical protein
MARSSFGVQQSPRDRLRPLPARWRAALLDPSDVLSAHVRRGALARVFTEPARERMVGARARPGLAAAAGPAARRQGAARQGQVARAAELVPQPPVPVDRAAV